MKTLIYNLIILDESGSMDLVRTQTITGCNETIQTIQAAQREKADNQEHYISIYAFQEGSQPSRYLIKNVPALATEPITAADYDPCGCTPLYDAVGSTVADLKHTCAKHELAIGSVTIITDGYENASKEYTLAMVNKMISALKEQGWNFNFIGANIDVERVSRSMAIDNAMAFQQDAEGTRRMFAREARSRQRYYERLSLEVDACLAADASPESVRERMKTASLNYFEDEENNENC